LINDLVCFEEVFFIEKCIDCASDRKKERTESMFPKWVLNDGRFLLFVSLGGVFFVFLSGNLEGGELSGIMIKAIERERERERASNELCSSSCFSMFSTSSLAAEKLSVGIEQV
jgi:hypothetical protein